MYLSDLKNRAWDFVLRCSSVCILSWAENCMLGKGVRLRNPELARAASCMQGHCLPPPAPIRRDSRSLFRESCPCSAIPSLPGQAFSWLQLSFLWTSSLLGYIQQCGQLFTAAPGLLFLPDTSVLSFSFELTLPWRLYAFPWESFHPPACPSPLCCSPRPAFTLGSAFLDSVVFSSGFSWWPGTAALLTRTKAYVTPIPTSLNGLEPPRLLTVDSTRPRSHKCDKSPPISLHASLSCTLCDSVNGSSVYQLTEPRTSWPCLPACCSISLARTLQWPSESTLYLASLTNTLNLSDPSGDRDRNTQSSGLSLTTKRVQGQPEIHEAHSQK